MYVFLMVISICSGVVAAGWRARLGRERHAFSVAQIPQGWQWTQASGQFACICISFSLLLLTLWRKEGHDVKVGKNILLSSH